MTLESGPDRQRPMTSSHLVPVPALRWCQHCSMLGVVCALLPPSVGRRSQWLLLARKLSAGARAKKKKKKLFHASYCSGCNPPRTEECTQCLSSTEEAANYSADHQQVSPWARFTNLFTSTDQNTRTHVRSCTNALRYMYFLLRGLYTCTSPRKHARKD
jgi:hypothetical protein